jgi:hypothetical protein
MSPSDIPYEALPIGISLCYDNARRLLGAANAYIRDRYVGPGALPPELATELEYGSGSGLAVLTLEEIGKAFLLLKNYHAKKNVLEKEWALITRDPHAHQKKIELAEELLRCQLIRDELNKMKQSGLYVDWREGKWRSPSYFKIKDQKTVKLLETAKKALDSLKTLLEENDVDWDPLSLSEMDDSTRPFWDEF